MLIALTGLHPHTGVTTTAVALAECWPAPHPAIVLEADPTGGTLAQLASADPHRGLASLAEATTTSPGSPVAAQIWKHVQLLESGVPFLAAPENPDAAAATLSAPAPVPRARGLADMTMIADCGAADPASAAAPLILGADVTVVVVAGDLDDPVQTGRRIREVTAGCRRRAVVLVGARQADEFGRALEVPVLGRLALDPRGAEAVLTGVHHGRRSAGSARGVTSALHRQLHMNASSAPAPRRTQGPAGSSRRRRGVCTGPVGSSADRRHQLPGMRDSEHATASVPVSGDFGLEVTSTDHPAVEPATAVPETGSGAAQVPESSRCGPVLAIEVFGPLRVCWHTGGGEVDITARLQPRGRELLTLLALHPDGTPRETVLDNLWGERCPRRPTNAVHTAISRLTTAISGATDGAVSKIVTADHSRYHLDAAIAVDYQRFTEAVRHRRLAANDDERAQACRDLIDITGRGVLAGDLATAWIAPIREAARRDTITAAGTLASTLVEHNPRRALDLLETSLDHDPLNELLWRDIFRLHARLGEHSALDRTMSLLAHKLSEIGETPTTETRDLVHRLRQQAHH